MPFGTVPYFYPSFPSGLGALGFAVFHGRPTGGAYTCRSRRVGQVIDLPKPLCKCESLRMRIPAGESPALLLPPAGEDAGRYG